MQKEYIGDGVYVAPGDPTASYQEEMVLSAEDGIRATDIIYLEELMWQRIIVYGVRMGWKLPAEVVT